MTLSSITGNLLLLGLDIFISICGLISAFGGGIFFQRFQTSTPHLSPYPYVYLPSSYNLPCSNTSLCQCPQFIF